MNQDDLLNQLPIEKDFKYFYGKNGVVKWLDAIRDISFICNQYDTEVCVFFHNARFDFSYIQYYILKKKEGYICQQIIIIIPPLPPKGGV